MDTSAHIMTPTVKSGVARISLTPTSVWRHLLLMRVFATMLLVSLACLGQSTITLTRVATGVPDPTDIQSAKDGSQRLFVVQQNGLIRILRDGQLLATPFLDIAGRIAAGGERGLLGLAFPPGFADKHYFYVNYTDRNGNTVVARYRVSPANSDIADPSSEEVILRQQQPYANHNGGQLQFGPDGYLYVGLGDGGSANDPQGNGQNRRTFLGKILRLDVESDLSAYRVPSSNPFVGDPSYLPEIWALGVRNPWRFSFDNATGDLWIADVGQGRAEEIDFQPSSSKGGENYGWKLMEGLECLPGTSCNTAGLVLPIWEYEHGSGDCSVTGGYVYRGTQAPGLRGTYVYSDYCSGRIWGLRREGDRWVNQLLLQTGRNITTFGQDESGETYIGDAGSGELLLLSGNEAPQFTAASVVNAASYRSGIVPGSLATVFAAGILNTPGIVPATSWPLPTSLAGVSVSAGGHAAPLYAITNVAGTEQVNFQVPFELAGQTEASIIITREGISSSPVTVEVSTVQPAVFTLDGLNGVVVMHATNALVTPSNPVAGDSIVYLYATGMGPVNGNPQTGTRTPVDRLFETTERPQVTLGGIPCEVLFAGLAPELAGVYQVNLRIPSGLSAPTADLVISVGGDSSPAVKVRLR